MTAEREHEPQLMHPERGRGHERGPSNPSNHRPPVSARDHRHRTIPPSTTSLRHLHSEDVPSSACVVGIELVADLVVRLVRAGRVGFGLIGQPEREQQQPAAAS